MPTETGGARQYLKYCITFRGEYIENDERPFEESFK